MTSNGEIINMMNFPQASTSVVSCEVFSQIEKRNRENEDLKHFGLSNEEIKIYNEYRKGADYIGHVHKNMEDRALKETIADILEKIQNAKSKLLLDDCEDSSKYINDDQKQVYSIDPRFLLKPKISQDSFINNQHPINHLDELHEDLFGHMDVDQLPSGNKQRKILRRMKRKLTKETIIPEPIYKSFDTAVSQVSETNEYHDFVRSGTHDELKEIKMSCDTMINTNSKWDIKTLDPKEKEINTVKKAKQQELDVKKIGCKPETLYTIKNNKIVRLEIKKKDSTATDKVQYEAVDIKLPINRAEEKLLEGSRLSLEDIRKIPKFEKYETGDPSKVLYLKNISNRLIEEDLKMLFQDYDKGITIQLMNGKMRGQAFIYFTSQEIAIKALNDKNGTIIKGKPIIIQFGKKNNS